MNSINTKNHYHDVLIIGSGGSGLTAALFAADKKLDVAVISKVHPLKSHTIAAQGGINASLGNITRDDWRWHAYDTIKASDWLADQDSVEEMCKSAPDMIHMLDQLGVEFDRTSDGRINQKIYGGQSTEFGKGEFAHRACYSKDKTGDSIMHQLFKAATSKQVLFYNYNFAIDLIMHNDQCHGVICWDIENGVLNIIRANNVIIATGGYSQIYATATSSAVCTGDGNGLVLRAGIALQDMEFIQFHPTALSKIGILITEAARSAGGRLLNSKGEKFMEKYAPKFLELAARDVVARAIAEEIDNGHGCGPDKDHVLLDLTHLGEEEIKTQLPTIFENCSSFAKLNPSKQPIPIAPAAHYTMGGIPTDPNCQVVKYDNKQTTKITGLYAIGEAACISVHGASRLGCNSLLDLLVFAKKAVESLSSQNISSYEFADHKKIIADFNKIFTGKNTNIEQITKKMKSIMSHNVGVFRNKEGLSRALDEITKLQAEYQNITITDKSLTWNMELQHYFELGNMLSSAITTTRSALWRLESRGAHWRQDHQEKNSKFHGHTMCHNNTKLENILLRPVRMSVENVDFYQPTSRNY